MGWRDAVQDLVHSGAHSAEETFDRLIARVRARTGRTDPVVVQPFRGFGTPDELRVTGRVLEDPGIRPPTDRDTLWQNLVAMYRRFESDEVSGARLEIALGETRVEVVSDEEGYFEVRLRPEMLRESSEDWKEVEVRLIEPAPARALARVLIPHPDADFGVISDIDDTILPSGATSLTSLARATFLHNARTRLPFKGAAAFYRALREGPPGRTGIPNPFFYVSSSPWNLYDFLEDFFDLNRIPEGPILLQDLGIDAEKFIHGGHEHKLEKIERILRTYPHLSFVLIGDSGQEDPELYTEAVERHPGRIRAIYVRDVTPDARDALVRRLIAAVADRGVEARLVADSAEAAEHAAEIGLIDPATLPAIRGEARGDEDP
jgi:phosphatidate phosphatase APP1